MELAECRKVFGDRYIKVNAFDSTLGFESMRMSFIVNRPEKEVSFRLRRIEAPGRTIRYELETVKP
jgi:ribulose-bisphosphate carboxylase small chain